MLSVLLSLVAATVWGGSDFSAGIASRRVGALHASLLTFLGATVLLLIAVPVIGTDWSSEAVSAGLVAALGATVGFVAFYAGLALAPIGVVTAIVAACEVVVPVLVAVIWKGEQLTLLGWVGIVAAGAGAVIVGASEGGWGGAGLRAVVLAVIGGVGFGLSVVALDFAPESSGVLAPGLEMAGGRVLVTLLVLVMRAVPSLKRSLESLALFVPEPQGVRGGIGLGLLAGALQGGANIVLMFALWAGQLAVVGAISALYPVSAVLLAWVILKEKLSAPLVVGIAIALSGCVLLGVA